MDSSEKRELSNINKIDLFSKIMKKLTINDLLNDDEKTYILSCAIMFIKEFEKTNKQAFWELAYYIILKYSIIYNEYEPLYDFAMNFGFYPISNTIINQELLKEESIDGLLLQNRINKYRHNKVIETKEQFRTRQEIINDRSKEISFIAPTSYGKSSIIRELIENNNDNKIGIIVPTKSLINQTFRNLKPLKESYRIIIHDDMYEGEEKFIGIFTQERALRMMERENFYFDTLYIDEAHNILDLDYRSILISRLIKKNKSLNNEQKIIYLSPLVADSDNLKVNKDQLIKEHRIKFNVKEPEIYEYRLNGEIYKYNRFINEFYKLYENESMYSYIQKNSTRKTFIFIKKPKLIEEFCNEFAEKMQVINNVEINQLVEILEKYVHKDFYMINLIKKGIVYLHGKIPDRIKDYIEYKYNKIEQLKYVVANNVILEGVNLPISTLHILSTNYVSPSELINLIGRVNRLNEIFIQDGNGLDKLLPQIHFINSQKYNAKNTNMKNKIEKLRSNIFEYKIENPILDSYDIDKLKLDSEQKEKRKEKNENIINKEEIIFKDVLEEREIVKKKLVESGISEFYSSIESIIDRILEVKQKITNFQAWRKINIIDKIYVLFINNIESILNYEVLRLKYKETRNYYKKFLNDCKKGINENIQEQFAYFKSIQHNPLRNKFYIGESYGEIIKQTENYSGFAKKVYVDLREKNDFQLINLAIVKIKMEEDFINYKIKSFLELMLKVGLKDEEEYNSIIYGTNDVKKLELIKKGISINIVNKLDEDNQIKNLTFDSNNNLQSNLEFDKYKNNLDDFLQFELNKYL